MRACCEYVYALTVAACPCASRCQRPIRVFVQHVELLGCVLASEEHDGFLAAGVVGQEVGDVVDLPRREGNKKGIPKLDKYPKVELSRKATINIVSGIPLGKCVGQIENTLDGSICW